MPGLAEFDEATAPRLRELAGALETRKKAGSPYKPNAKFILLLNAKECTMALSQQMPSSTLVKSSMLPPSALNKDAPGNQMMSWALRPT